MAASSALSDADGGALFWFSAGAESFAALDKDSVVADGGGVASGISDVGTTAAVAMGSVGTGSGRARGSGAGIAAAIALGGAEAGTTLRFATKNAAAKVAAIATAAAAARLV